MSYVTFKKSVRDYVKSDGFNNLDIKANIENYNHLTDLFNDLKNNPSESVERLGGINSLSVQNLINEYFRLQNENAELNTTLYSRVFCLMKTQTLLIRESHFALIKFRFAVLLPHNHSIYHKYKDQLMKKLVFCC